MENYTLIILIMSFPLFIGLILFYFKIADKFNIIDKPNERSSHVNITIRGGGILFPIAFLLSSVFFQVHLMATVAVLLVSIISFVDDIKSQSSLVRLIIQLTAMAILFYAVGLYFEPWWILILALIFSVAVVNAYNFMDGINGITALNSFVVLGSLIIVNQDGGFDYHNISLIQVMISVVVFSIFNFRTKAKCFAGDVGSISMSFIILYALLDLIFKKGFHFEYILLLTVYGADTLWTVIQRVYEGEKITEPHRKHLYQYLIHTAKMKHLNVSIIYGSIQLIISLILIWNLGYHKIDMIWFTFSVLILYSIGYWLIKLPLIKRHTLS